MFSRNGGRRREDIHQSTALRRARAALAQYGGEVHSEKGRRRRAVMSWSTSSYAGDQVLVAAETWGCAVAGLVAAVATYQAERQPRPREGVEL